MHKNKWKALQVEEKFRNENESTSRRRLKACAECSVLQHKSPFGGNVMNLRRKGEATVSKVKSGDAESTKLS